MKVVFVDKMTPFTLLISIGYAILGNCIYYKSTTKFFQNDFGKSIIKILKFERFPVPDFKAHYKAESTRRAEEVLGVIEKKIQCENLANISDKFVKLRNEKLTIQFISKISINQGYTFISKIEEYFSGAKKIKYISLNLSDVSLMSYTSRTNIKALQYPILIIMLIELILKCPRALSKKAKRKKRNSKQNKMAAINNKTRVMYFPHKSLKCGSAYKKIDFYNNDKESHLFYKDVLTCFYNTPQSIDSSTKRLLTMYGMPSAYINSTINLIYGLKCMVMVFSRTSLKISLRVMLIKFLIKYLGYIENLSPYKHILAAFFEYDVLVPPELLLALSYYDIKTISYYSRFYHCYWYKYVMYDYYFVASAFFEGVLKKSKYYNKTYLIKSYNRKTLYCRPLKKLSNTKKYILGERNSSKTISVLGLFPILDEAIYDSWDVGISIKSNNDLLRLAFEVACKYKNCNVILQFKLYNKEVCSLIKRNAVLIREASNLFVTDLSRVSVYDIISFSDIIISKSSNIAEEALSFEKNVMIYDNELYVKGFYDTYLTDIGCVSFDRGSVFNFIDRVIRSGFAFQYDIEKVRAIYGEKYSENSISYYIDSIVSKYECKK